MAINQRDIKVRQLWDHGVRSTGEIAKRIGYAGAIEQGIKKVEKILEKLEAEGLIER